MPPVSQMDSADNANPHNPNAHPQIQDDDAVMHPVSPQGAQASPSELLVAELNRLDTVSVSQQDAADAASLVLAASAMTTNQGASSSFGPATSPRIN